MSTEKTGQVSVSGGTVGVVSTGSNARIQVNTNHIGAMSGADETDRAKLEQLVQELNTALKAAPPEKQAEAEAVAVLTEDLVKKAAEEKPNHALLNITANGMKEAAGALAAVIPSTVTIVGKIAELVLGLPK